MYIPDTALAKHDSLSWLQRKGLPLSIVSFVSDQTNPHPTTHVFKHTVATGREWPRRLEWERPGNEAGEAALLIRPSLTVISSLSNLGTGTASVDQALAILLIPRRY